MNRIHNGEHETMLDDTQDRKSQTKERTVYDREFLLQCRSSPLANEMPLELKIIDGDEGSAFCSFINPEGQPPLQTSSSDNYIFRRFSSSS